MKMAPILNRRVKLEERVSTLDGAGGFTNVWNPIGTMWAAIDTRRGAERRIGERMVPALAHKVIVRAAPVGAPSRPRPDQRFSDQGRIFVILAVSENDPHGLYLECWCEEGTGA